MYYKLDKEMLNKQITVKIQPKSYRVVLTRSDVEHIIHALWDFIEYGDIIAAQRKELKLLCKDFENLYYGGTK